MEIVKKKCSICKKIFALSQFYKNQHTCKTCQKKYYQQNREKIKRYIKKYRKLNRDKLSKQHVEYYKTNADKMRKWHKEYRQGIKNGTIKKMRTSSLKGKDLTVMPKNVKFNYDFGYCLEAILGDGHLYSHPDLSKGRHMIRLRVTSREFAEYFKEKLQTVTGKTLAIVPYTRIIKRKKINLYRVICCSKSWVKYFRFLSKNLDRFVNKASKKALTGYIRGYIDAEGCVSLASRSSGITVKGVNKSYMESFAKALDRLGFHTIRYLQHTNKGRLLYEVTIKGIYFVRKYAIQIGFIDVKKQLKALSKDYKTKWSRERSLRRFGICLG